MKRKMIGESKLLTSVYQWEDYFSTTPLDDIIKTLSELREKHGPSCVITYEEDYQDHERTYKVEWERPQTDLEFSESKNVFALRSIANKKAAKTKTARKAKKR